MSKYKHVFGVETEIEKQNPVMTPAVSELLRSHMRYIGNLDTWSQYIIWFYTMGSGSVNRFLAKIPLDLKIQHWWATRFFSYYNVKLYGINNIPEPYKVYKRFFENSKGFEKLPFNVQTEISTFLMEAYINSLQTLILQAPKTVGPITLYKVSSQYPGLPVAGKVAIVEQGPFNSTTWDKRVNLSMFLPNLNVACCYWVLSIAPGTSLLAIDAPVDAYPEEREVLLPYGSVFDIKEAHIDIVRVKVTTGKTEMQFGPPYVIGEVYQFNAGDTIELKMLTYHANCCQKK